MMMYSQYPTGTYIKCVMVGGEGHGQSHLRSPVDANGFKMMKRQAVSPMFFTDAEEDMLRIDTQTLYYEPFAEIFTRDGFVRLFAIRDYRSSTRTSFLQIADALRIAGIEEL